jgi:hypothetical protein
MSDPKIVQLIPAPGWRCYTAGITASGGTTWEAEDDVVAFALMADGSVQTLVSDDETIIVPLESLAGPNTWSRLVGPSQKITNSFRNLVKGLARGRFENSAKRCGRVVKNLSLPQRREQGAD